MSELSTRIQLKRDLASNWNAVSASFRLLPGELGFETDTGYVKIGIPGESGFESKGALWKDTPYVNVNDVSSVNGLIGALAATKLEAIEATKNTFALYTDVDVTNITDGKNTGDIAVIKKSIAGGKFEYTAYVWNAEITSDVSGWQAMDGNYSAENVFFKDDITLAGDYDKVGNVKLADGTLSASGKSVKTLMDNIFTKELAGAIKTNPSTSAPTLYAKVNGAGSEVAAARSYEYGTYLTDIRFAGASFTKGTYTYGPDTAQTTCTWETQGVNIAITTGDTSNVGTCESVVIGDKGVDTDNPTLKDYTTNSTFSVKTKGLTVADTVEANTNLGNTNTEAGFAKVSFAANANMSFKESGRFTGFRNMFFGSKVTPVEKTNANIRGLSPTASGTKTDFAISIAEGANQVLLAVPSNLKVTKVLDVNAFGTDIFSAFNESSLDVEGANGYTAIAYRIYEMLPDASLAANTFKVTITKA